MLVLGLNMFHADASAAIIQDGEVIFAIAEDCDSKSIALSTTSLTSPALTTVRRGKRPQVSAMTALAILFQP